MMEIRKSGRSLILLAMVFAASGLGAMTVDLGGGGVDYINLGDSWRYFKGTVAPSSPITDWKEVGFPVPASWGTGPSGFGYGDNDDATVLADMKGSYTTVYIRKEFTVDAPVGGGSVVLRIDYDDGFVAYLNGKLVAWRHMSVDPTLGTVNQTTVATAHEVGSPEDIVLGQAADLLVAGTNVLAIEGHNESLGASTDFSLLPALHTASSVVKDGSMWVVESAGQTLHGVTSSPQAVSVRVGGDPATFNPADRSWQIGVTLTPGLNHLTAEALDGGGAVVDSGSVDILYVPAAQHLGGTLAGDTTLTTEAGGYIVDQDLVVPAGTELRIEPGVVVYVKSLLKITVSGALLSLGTAAQPVRFTHFGDGTRWRRILFIHAADSHLASTVFEYTDSVGDHQDYYVAGSRNYHEAVVLIGSHADFEKCVFQKMPDVGGEGDALAVISDDPDQPGVSSATFRQCRFLGIGQGIHERFSYVLVEECYFQDKHGDNDDVDLWGESDPTPMIRNNFFDVPVHEDRINPTRCSAIIIGNTLMGSSDQGIVLRDRCSPVVMNNVIRNCTNTGIAVENSCTALLVNNTIESCGTGMRLFDLGRWDPPYSLNPGGGTATVINTIIWNCGTSFRLEDSPSTTIADKGSHLTVSYSDVVGGRPGVSISGAQSTVTWGAGNISVDPMLVNAAAVDFHLRAGSPAIDTGTADQAPAVDRDGNPRPCGAGFDMGAYEVQGASCGPVTPRFIRGDSNADGVLDISDPLRTLFHLFAGEDLSCPMSADFDASEALDLADVVAPLGYLFLGLAAPSAPFPACGQGSGSLSCDTFPPCP
jgi:parallel beta-helix repeat protein